MPNHTTQKIALFGEWNTTNIGDQAIGDQAAKFLIGIGFTVKMFALGNLHYLGEVADPREVDHLFSRAAPPVAQTPTAEKKKQTQLYRQVIRWIAHGKLVFLSHALRYLRNYTFARKLRPELKECQAIVVGGGALLDDEQLRFPLSLLFIKNLSVMLNLPLFCLGCSSSGKFSPAGKRILRDFLQQAQVVAVRDEATRQITQSFTRQQVSLFGDFALELPGIQQAYQHHNGYNRQDGAPARFGINVMQHVGVYFAFQEPYEQFIKGLIDDLLSHKAGLEITLYTTGNQVDLEVAQRLQKGVPHRVLLFHPASLEEMKTFYQDKEMVTATRLHAAIMALSEGTPAVSVYLAPKIRNFFATIGLEDYSYDALSADNPTNLVEMVVGQTYQRILSTVRVDAFWEARQAVSGKLKALREMPG